MNIVARIKFSSKLKNSTSEIGYYSYTNPDYAIAYYNRGFAKDDLKDYSGAIADYNKAIGLDPDYAIAYVNRGVAKELIGDLNGACSDWKKAANLGDTDSAKWVANQCN